MTLKEKFRPLVWFNSGSFNVHQNKEKDENSIKCEKIADDYAIEFAYWLIYQDICQRGENNFVCADGIQRNTEQLLEIFKKEKGL